MLSIKRVYDEPSEDDGVRILVDRLWPRGLSKEDADIDEWRKDLAPSDELRKWYGHEPAKWEEFKRRYREELASQGKFEDLKEIANKAQAEQVTLVFGARDIGHSNAEVLKELAESIR